MNRYHSLRLNLDEITSDNSFEEDILQKLLKCRNHIGKEFKLILWNKKISEKDVKLFVKRNNDTLFKLNTKITKEFKRVWFLIDQYGEDSSQYRYKWTGNISKGLDEYIKMINHIRKRIK